MQRRLVFAASLALLVGGAAAAASSSPSSDASHSSSSSSSAAAAAAVDVASSAAASSSSAAEMHVVAPSPASASAAVRRRRKKSNRNLLGQEPAFPGLAWMGTGACVDSDGRQYARSGLMISGTFAECASHCPSVHLRGVEDEENSPGWCFCLYSEGERPDPSKVSFGESPEPGLGEVWDGTGHVKGVKPNDDVFMYDCYKNTRIPDNFLNFTGDPDLTLASGTHTVRIPYDRSVGWDWDVKYYEVYKDDENANKCNFTEEARITDYLAPATEEGRTALPVSDNYPRESVTVRIDFVTPRETTFCVRTKLVDPFDLDPNGRPIVVNFDEQILTVKLARNNIFTLEDDSGVDLLETDAATVSQDFTYSLTAYECPEGFEPQAENVTDPFGTSQDGTIKLCVKTSSDEVVVDNDSLTVNVTQNGTDYTDTHGMTEGTPNGFLGTMDGTSDGNNATNSTRRLESEGYMRRLGTNGRISRCAFLPVEAMYVNGNPIEFSGEADILFAAAGIVGKRRRLRATFRYRIGDGAGYARRGEHEEGRTLQEGDGEEEGDDDGGRSDYAGHGGFQLGVKLPPRSAFDSDLQTIDGVTHDEDASNLGSPTASESYSAAASETSWKLGVAVAFVVAVAAFSATA